MKFANQTTPTLEELNKMMDRNCGSLDLEGTSITALPDGLSVGGSLDLRGCTGITALPDGLSVGGHLDLDGTNVPAIYRDERGYELRRIMCGSDEWWVAGCRVFTSRVAALAHWGADDYPVQSRGAMFCEAISNTPREVA